MYKIAKYIENRVRVFLSGSGAFFDLSIPCNHAAPPLTQFLVNIDDKVGQWKTERESRHMFTFVALIFLKARGGSLMDNENKKDTYTQVQKETAKISGPHNQ